MTTRAKLLYLLALSGWFILALGVGSLSLFKLLPFWGPPVVPVTLAGIATATYFFSQSFRSWVAHLGLWPLVATGLLRIFAVDILLLYGEGDLPGTFALPAGGGAVFVAIFTAFCLVYGISRKTHPYKLLLVWNVVGLLHLIMVIGLVVGHIFAGKGYLLLEFQTLPLNLFPVFIVPLSLWAHIILFSLIKSLQEMK